MGESIFPVRGGALWDWGQEKLQTYFDPKQAVGIALVRNHGPAAITFFDRFTGNDCCMHIASDGTKKWLTPRYLFECFCYPFLQNKQTRVTGLVPARNVAALQFDQKLGFKHEGVLRCGLPDDDLIVLGMLAQECRFIRPEYLRRFAAHGQRLKRTVT